MRLLHFILKASGYAIALLIMALIVYFFMLLGNPFLIYLVIFFMLAIIIFWFILFIKGKAMKEFFLKNWESTKSMMKVEQDFELVENEKILFPLMPCFIRAYTVLSFSLGYCHDVIVTNKRILIGFPVFYMKETFGDVNLWRPTIVSLPPYKGTFGIIGELLGGNMKIKNISHGIDRFGEYVEVEAWYGSIPKIYYIYHPKARQIYDMFSVY